jgi:hypothetical protein
MNTETTCTTCGRPAGQPYTNEAAGERCHDPIHTDLTPNDDVTVTVTREVAEALCTAAEFTLVAPGNIWTDDDGNFYLPTEQALVKALPRIAEIGTYWRADNEEMAEAQNEARILQAEADADAALELRAGQSLGENEPQQRPHDSDSENGPNAGDAEQDYLDHVKALEERASARPAVGARVLFVDQLDRYPHFTVPAGATGIVTQSDLDIYTVKVDQTIPGAEEWNNEVIWQVSDDEEPATDLRLAGAFVKHEVIHEMSYDELGKAIAEGGPSELIDAMVAERRERQRKADSIYHGDWDEQGTISVHLPAGDNVHWAGWLEARGWTFRAGRWNSPGDDASVFYLSEALQRQLLAEALR